MSRPALNRRPTVAQMRVASGMVMGIYVIMHLANHSLGLISLSAQEAARPWIMRLWQSWPGLLALYGSLLVHSGLGLRSLFLRRHFRIARWELMALLSGLAIPYLLLVHITNTRGTRILTGIDIDYAYEIANLWIDPWVRGRQVLLVVLVWGHFAAGLHFWLRSRPWYRRHAHLALAMYLLVPVIGLLGFAESGKVVSAQAQANPAWWKWTKGRGTPADAQRAALRAGLRQWAGSAWLALAGAVFVAGRLRNRWERRRRFAVTYPEGPAVNAPVGMSVLEVSRMARRPHTAVCGGRGRCTTCRVRVHQTVGDLPAMEEAETRALTRMRAPEGLRLACQLRPQGNLTIQPLVAEPQGGAARLDFSGAFGFGEEKRVTVLFLDVRGSTRLAEKRLPYDVVFLMSHFFAQMSEAVEQAGGHYSNFTGDGLMALFGLESEPAAGAPGALACALGMLERLEEINRRMAGELETPLAIGIGIHTGEAIVGRMGPPRTPILTALGDTVNTTARLEGMTKELGTPLVVSQATLLAAGLGEVKLQKVDVPVRGRAANLQVAALDLDALAFCLVRGRAQAA